VDGLPVLACSLRGRNLAGELPPAALLLDLLSACWQPCPCSSNAL
jgi:hypothetical protein